LFLLKFNKNIIMDIAAISGFLTDNDGSVRPAGTVIKAAEQFVELQSERLNP
jgi:hypothetical protein